MDNGRQTLDIQRSQGELITKQDSKQIGPNWNTSCKNQWFLTLYTGELNSHIHRKNGLPSILYQISKPVICRNM